MPRTSKKAHAMLGASSAHRWLVCTPSAKLESTLPEESSPYAEEGTLAHSFAEQKLLALSEPREVICEDEEMDEATTKYAEFVAEEFAAAEVSSDYARLVVEQKLDFSDLVPGGFGTADAVIVSDHLLEVIDFKYGKGVPVSAENNPQLRLYALGAVYAIGSLYDFEKVKTVIFQPRIDNITTETLDLVELLDWGANYVAPRAKKAAKGKGDYVTGDHCRFCRAAGVCRARAEEAFKVIKKDKKLPPLLEDAEIPAILDVLDDTEKWIAAIRKYAHDKAVREGVKWEGYKLVEARTQRKIPDQLAALERLRKAGYSDEDVTNVKLKGITDLEKLLTKSKFSEVLGDLVVKPLGEPTLVKESDKRPEFNPLENAFKEDI